MRSDFVELTRQEDGVTFAVYLPRRCPRCGNRNTDERHNWFEPYTCTNGCVLGTHAHRHCGCGYVATSTSPQVLQHDCAANCIVAPVEEGRTT